ncbi:hypothetical protein GQR36_11935 [Enterococcus termitis]
MLAFYRIFFFITIASPNKIVKPTGLKKNKKFESKETTALVPASFLVIV